MHQEPKHTRCLYCAETAIKEFCNNPDSPNYLKTPIQNQKACAYAKLKEQEEISVIIRMHHNIKAYNKTVTKKFLRKQTPLQLLHLVHEIDRREFAIELCKEGFCLTDEIKHYLVK